MPLSDLKAILGDRRMAVGELREFAVRCAAAVAAEYGSPSSEIWLWRSAIEGDRRLELIASFGPRCTPAGVVTADGEWAFPVPVHVDHDARRGSIAHCALGPHGFVSVARVTGFDPAALDQLAHEARALGERLFEFLPREELQFSNRWLLRRSALDRRAAKSFAAVKSVEDLAELVESLTGELFRLEYAGIYFVDPLTGRLRLVSAKGLTESERLRAERTAGARHPGEVLRTGRTVEVDDLGVAADPSQPPSHGRHIRSRMYLPVRVDGTVVGTIGFASSEPAHFGQRHRLVLSFLCDLAGIAYARLRGQMELERRGELIEATSTANERLLMAMDWRQAATAALGLVGSALAAGTLAVVRRETSAMSEQMDFVWQPSFGAPWPNRDRFAHPTPTEVASLTRGDALERAEAPNHPAFLVKPIIVSGALWGVLVLEARNGAIPEIGRPERAAMRAVASGFSSAISREQMDRELRERQSVDAVNKLAAGIAHDFNDLLWPVLLYSETLERGAGLDDKSRQMLRDMRRSAVRASELVQQVFAISRHRDRALQVVDVAELAIEVSTTLRRAVPATTSVFAHIDSDAGQVIGDEDAVRQMLVNTFAHALNSLSEQRGAVRIDVERVERDRGSWILIAIADDGPTPRTDLVALNAVQRAAAEHGGKLQIRAGGSGGTVREILLPIALREPTIRPIAEVVRSTQPLPSQSPDAERVLLVDDDEAVLAVARQILESIGYQILACANPSIALKVLEDPSTVLSLLLTDLAMPEMDGLTLARESKRLRPTLPVVCCTGFGDARAERTAHEIGVAAFIRKPIDFDHFASTIRSAIDGVAKR